MHLQLFVRSINSCVRRFSPDNPTGRYRFDLSDTADWEVAKRLADMRVESMSEEEKQPPVQGRLPVNVAEAPESVILNSKLNGEMWTFNSRTSLPHGGIWMFDYVHRGEEGGRRG